MMQKWKALAGCASLVLFDQITKIWACHALRGRGAIPLIDGVLELLYVENRGAAFGILQNKQWVFLIMSVFVLAVLIYMIPRLPGERRFRRLRICLYLTGAGAAGNMIDRCFRKYVVDFIYFKLIDFPVFNVADIYVTVSAFFLVLLIIFYYKDEDFDRIFPKRG